MIHCISLESFCMYRQLEMTLSNMRTTLITVKCQRSRHVNRRNVTVHQLFLTSPIRLPLLSDLGIYKESARQLCT